MSDAEEFLTFEQVLRELQIEDAELRRLVAQGEIRTALGKKETMFRRVDVMDYRKRREASPTMTMPELEEFLRRQQESDTTESS